MIGPKQPKPTKAQERAAYDAVTIRDNGRCVRCGWNGSVHRDHRQNRMPGNTVVSNLQLMCGPHGDNPGCHAWSHANPADSVREGFAVPRWARPGFWPGFRWDVGSWVIYFDEPDSRGRWWDQITESTAEMLMRGGEHGNES